MPDLVNVTYEQTGRSMATDGVGMREMQAKAFAQRERQYLLIKAPPASGKSRAMMFIGLDKLFNQGRKKVIVAVPERSIGASFASTELTASGFFADWEVPEASNLCSPGSDSGKVAAFQRFLEGPDPILVCTHATLRFAHDAIDPEQFDGTVLAIDEFHHVSSGENSQLGQLMRSVMAETDAHIVAMTGSYFRGDAVPVLEASDEARFTKVTYNYYEQLNGYTLPEVAWGSVTTSTTGRYVGADPRGAGHRPEDDPAHSQRAVGRVDQGQDERGRLDPRRRSATFVRQDKATGVIEVQAA